MPNFNQTGPQGIGPTGGRRGICGTDGNTVMPRTIERQDEMGAGNRRCNGNGRGRGRTGTGRTVMHADTRRGQGRRNRNTN